MLARVCLVLAAIGLALMIYASTHAGTPWWATMLYMAIFLCAIVTYPSGKET